MGMPPGTRLSLAQQTYQVALRAARGQSTSRTWLRLLRAARNLREATWEAARRAGQGARRGGR